MNLNLILRKSNLEKEGWDFPSINELQNPIWILYSDGSVEDYDSHTELYAPSKKGVETFLKLVKQVSKEIKKTIS